MMVVVLIQQYFLQWLCQLFWLCLFAYRRSLDVQPFIAVAFDLPATSAVVVCFCVPLVDAVSWPGFAIFLIPKAFRFCHYLLCMQLIYDFSFFFFLARSIVWYRNQHPNFLFPYVVLFFLFSPVNNVLASFFSNSRFIFHNIKLEFVFFFPSLYIYIYTLNGRCKNALMIINDEQCFVCSQPKPNGVSWIGTTQNIDSDKQVEVLKCFSISYFYFLNIFSNCKGNRLGSQIKYPFQYKQSNLNLVRIDSFMGFYTNEIKGGKEKGNNSTTFHPSRILIKRKEKKDI